MASGSSPPPPSSSASPAESKAERTTILFDYVPGLKIAIPPKGPNSLEADERCFVYCSQSVAGRMRGQEPWCRAICFRKVFKHEVRTILYGKVMDPKHPLPPEGQKAINLWQTKLRYLTGPEKEATWQSIENVVTHDPQYWREGWYVWASKNPHSTIRKIYNMRFSLGTQTTIEKRDEAARKSESEHSAQSEARDGRDSRQESSASGSQSNSSQKQPSGFIWDTTKDTILLPLPPPLPPIGDYISNALAPTYKVLALTKNSITSGQQLQLAEKIWEKAQTKDPFILAGNVIKKAWNTLLDADEDDEDSEKRNRPQ